MSQTSRRSLLAGFAAVPITAAGPRASAATDCAAEAFLTWLDAIGRSNALSLDEAEVQHAAHGGESAWYAVFDAMEDAIIAAPPSIAKAAVLALHELAYKSDESCRDEPVLHILSSGSDVDARMMLRVLACLAPLLSGRIAAFVSDILENPHQSLSASALGRAYRGEQRA